MRFHKAEITDIVRCSQRDQDFVNELQDYVAPIVNLISGQKYNYLRKYVPGFAQGLYYLLTSVSNLQTLGEEYTGTIRLSNDDIPSKWAQVLWMALFIGGESLFDKLLSNIGKKVHFSSTLTEQAKDSFIKVIDFLKENKFILIRLHHSMFYINGTFQNISNRFAGIKYVLLRQWMQDNNTTKSFKILGNISFCYLLFMLVKKIITYKNAVPISSVLDKSNVSLKMCVLCVENRTNTCATPCGHLFCWECIFDSLKHHSSCPVCREDILPSRIVLLQNYF